MWSCWLVFGVVVPKYLVKCVKSWRLVLSYVFVFINKSCNKNNTSTGISDPIGPQRNIVNACVYVKGVSKSNIVAFNDILSLLVCAVLKAQSLFWENYAFFSIKPHTSHSPRKVTNLDFVIQLCCFVFVWRDLSIWVIARQHFLSWVLVFDRQTTTPSTLIRFWADTQTETPMKQFL